MRRCWIVFHSFSLFFTTLPISGHRCEPISCRFVNGMQRPMPRHNYSLAAENTGLLNRFLGTHLVRTRSDWSSEMCPRSNRDQSAWSISGASRRSLHKVHCALISCAISRRHGGPAEAIGRTNFPRIMAGSVHSVRPYPPGTLTKVGRLASSAGSEYGSR